MRRVILAILAVCFVYVGVDVFWPLHRDLRQFDPVALGELETNMWQSYYGRQRLALFSELAEMLRSISIPFAQVVSWRLPQSFSRP